MRTLLCALGLWWAAPGDTPRALPQFGSEVSNVSLAVSVQRDGGAAGGLTAADFQVWDNGVPQQVEMLEAKEKRVHAVLVLDASVSVRGERLARLKSAACAFLRGLRDDDRATLIVFGEALRAFELVGPRGDQCRQLDAIQPSGSTALTDALYLGIQIVDARFGRPIVVAFSDGLDSVSWFPPSAVVGAAKRSEAVVYSVVTGSKSELFESLADETGGRQWSDVGNERLEGAFLQILADIRDRYELCYEPTGVPASGWHTLRVKLKTGGKVLRYRRGYRSHKR